jgi:FMN phosphatase YigB (HAD superfamily)
MAYKTIIFDFDGVLCRDYFYTNLKASYPEVSDFINTKIFVKGGDVSDKWMRGEFAADDVNKIISDNTGINFDELSNLFIESVYAMKIDNRLLDLAKTVVLEGKKVALVTNNMDVFNEITIKNYNLDKIFPVIVNSCDYGIMKHDENGRLFDIAMEKLGVLNYDGALLIDDSSKARTAFESKGGATFPYENYEQFEPWMKENLLATAG